MRLFSAKGLLVSFILAAAFAVGVSAATASSTTTTSLPKLLGWNGKKDVLLVRPAAIIYTGDSSGVLGGSDGTGKAGRFGHLQWSSWTANQAYGSGAVWLDNCTPDCASGTFSPSAVKVHVFRPHGPIFTRLTLTYTYGGKKYVDRRTLERQGAYWVYGIVSP